VVEISTPSYPALGKKSIWFGGKKNRSDLFNRDPYTESNTIPVMRYALKKWEPYLDRLRVLIAEAKAPDAAGAPAAGTSLASEMKQLAELHRGGVLTRR
jgi:hypothetical protein